MSLEKEKTHFQVMHKKLKSNPALNIFRTELFNSAQIYHLTITVPARRADSPERRKEILESSFAWKRRLAVEEVIESLKGQGLELDPKDFVDFCEAVTMTAEKPPTTLPPIPPPSSRSRKEPEGVTFYTKLLDGLRTMVKS